MTSRSTGEISDENEGIYLIEMVMAMVLLGIVGLSLSGILTQSAQIFVEGTARELTLQEGRFVSERIVRELRQAVPNSVVSSNEGTVSSGCLSAPLGFIRICRSSRKMS